MQEEGAAAKKGKALYDRLYSNLFMSIEDAYAEEYKEKHNLREQLSLLQAKAADAKALTVLVDGDSTKKVVEALTQSKLSLTTEMEALTLESKQLNEQLTSKAARVEDLEEGKRSTHPELQYSNAYT